MSKKIFSICLALVLLLCSAAAMAETFEGLGEGFKPRFRAVFSGL